MSAIDFIPIWTFIAFILALSAMCVEGGFRLGQAFKKKNHESDAPLGAIVASTLALLAFFLAFTFSIAANRFEERRQGVLREANAIGTAYLRTTFLPPQEREQLRKLYRDYTDLRVHVKTTPLELALSKTQQLQQELWNRSTNQATANTGSPVYALYIASLNDVIDVHEERVAAGLYGRVPMIVWIGLILLACLSMTIVGYACGLTGNRGWVGSTILALSFSTVLYLVADLDRPNEGVIQTANKPLIDLQNSIGHP
jgi:hypothetical protein